MNLIKIKDYILVLLISSLITTPFFNEASQIYLGLNLSYVVLVFFIVYIGIFIIKIIVKYNLKINKYHLLLWGFAFSLFNISQIFYLDNLVKYFIVVFAFLLSLILILDRTSIILNMKRIKNYVALFSIFGVLLSISDPHRLVIAWTTKSRMIYDSSAISIAVLLGFIVISTLFSDIKTYQKNTINFLILILMLVILSRGPIVSLFVVFFYYCLIYRKIGLLILQLMTGIAVAIYFITVRGDHNIDERFELAQLGLELFSNNIFGYGVGGYSNITGIVYPHNFIVELLVETGLFFTLLYILTHMYIFFKMIFKVSQVNPFFIILFLYLDVICIFSYSTIEMQRIIIPLFFISLISLENKYSIKNFRLKK